MKIKEWMITIGLTVLAGVFGYGSTTAVISGLKDDVRDIKVWRDTAIQQLSSMDAKLDLLLDAGGIEKPKHR